MAVPKVFISSTCFDLGEIRDQLQKFVRSFGFEPILSEYGDIFYHPDLHTHESCVYEVANCQLFVLIIGGRFGGTYKSDPSKSITNAEYEAARRHKLPVFAYVKSGVMASHHVYKQNKDNDFVDRIEYPSIEKNELALNIFRFIDDVRRSPNNNSLEPFDKFIDIEFHLRKQWAGLFFDFLKTREVKHQIDATNHLITGLASSNSKLEDLVKSLYRSLSKDSAEEQIENIETKSKTEEFFFHIFDDTDAPVGPFFFPKNFDALEAAKIDPTPLEWHEYLVKIGLFKKPKEKSAKGMITFHDGSYSYIPQKNLVAPLMPLYEDGVKKSTTKQREEILKTLMTTKSFPDETPNKKT